MQDLKLHGKKLLILGGTSSGTEDIVKYAKTRGIYTIVVDNVESSVAKELADEKWLISTADVHHIVERAVISKVDGVFAGISEFNLERTLTICEQLGLPFYATRRQFEILSNKKSFKELCKDHDIPVVREINLVELNYGAFKGVEYPVVVKPADSCGGKGVYICSSADELYKNYERSLDFSPGKQLLIEEYVTQAEVTIFYTIQDGEIYLTALADRYTRNRQNEFIPLPVAYIFPSRYLKNYQDNLNQKVISMFRSIGLQNGVLFIQAFVEKGEFTFYEMGFRLNGSMDYKILGGLNGLNSLEIMVNHALTGKMSETKIKDRIDPNFKDWSCVLSFLARPGRIDKMVGIEEVALYPEVIDIVPSYRVGDEIDSNNLGTLKQVLLRVYVTAQTQRKLGEVIARIIRSVRIVSTDGRSLLMPGFDTNELLKDR